MKKLVLILITGFSLIFSYSCSNTQKKSGLTKDQEKFFDDLERTVTLASIERITETYMKGIDEVNEALALKEIDEKEATRVKAEMTALWENSLTEIDKSAKKAGIKLIKPAQEKPVWKKALKTAGQMALVGVVVTGSVFALMAVKNSGTRTYSAPTSYYTIHMHSDGFGGYKGYDYNTGTFWHVKPDSFGGYKITSY